ncbi:MAG TPA: hypothetical protein VFM54_20165 [Micromonosporaceae bacterium]|nr:hypothetical protein [Micromonosporaceae bacterium]
MDLLAELDALDNDQLERFWRFHTDMRNTDAYPMLRDWVGTCRDLAPVRPFSPTSALST